MRACARDTASRLCVRTVLCSSAFSLAPPLRSTGSAAAEAALFARFLATSGRSDFSSARIVGYGLRPSRQRPGHDWRGRRRRSPGSRAKGFCACQGLRRRGVGMCLAISTPAVLPSVGRKTSAPRTCLTPLNTSPAPSPVNASRLPSRTTRASLGAGVVRYTFTVTDFHRLPIAGLPAHPSTASTADIQRPLRHVRFVRWSQPIDATLYLREKRWSVAMDQGFRRGFTTAEKTELWNRWQRGESLKAIGRAFGKPSSSIYFQVAPHGGIRPAARRRS